MAVDTVLAALSDRLPDYEKIRDVLKGSRTIKMKRETYLPSPDPLDVSNAGKLRYDAYLQRAAFYPATSRTLRGLVGMVFDKDPAVEAPDLLAPVLADASGSGSSLDQQAMATLSDVVGLGRAGLLADYPRTLGPTTVADAKAGNIRPTINFYRAEQIINWRTETIGARVMLSLIVLKETYVKADDGFTQETATRYRVLRLVNGRYEMALWTLDDTVNPPPVVPTDGKGVPLPEIPFCFVGALDNEPGIDDPPLLDLVEVNLHHFMNSADYEESVFLVGQPTPVFAGLTSQWVKEVFREETEDGHGNKAVVNKVRLGSRAAVPLPEGGSAMLLQAAPNTMAFEAMGHKEAQMIALGAKLIENTGTVQTATEASLDSVLDNSVLATAARNVSKAYRQALRFAWLFMTGAWVEDTEIIDYELSTDFAGKLMTAQDRAAIVKAWQDKAISYTEMRWGLKRAGTAYLDDEDAKAEIEADIETSLALEVTAAGALAEATGALDQQDEPVPPEKGAKGKKPPVKAK